MNKLAFLLDDQDNSPHHNNNLTVKNSDCFVCKNENDLYLKALEKKKVIKCILCSKLQHPICYNIAVQNDLLTNNFLCIPCRIIQNQPQLKKIESVVGPFIVFPKEKNRETMNFTLEEMHNLTLNRNQFNELCVYCLKLDIFDRMNKQYYYNWPSDNIVIKINDQIQSYNLDTLCIIDKQDILFDKEKNKFEYNLGDLQAKDSKPIAIGIGLISIGNLYQVIDKIIMKQPFTEQDMIKQYKEWAKDIEIAIPLKDQITQTLIKWPARGKFCSHFTCIDMYSYLEFNLQNQNLQKSRWACPICQNRLYIKDIIFDKYLYRFLREEIKEKIDPNYINFVEEVISDQNGNLQIAEESLQKIKMLQLKKYLIQENERIEKQILDSKKNFEDRLRIEMMINLQYNLEKNDQLSQDKQARMQEFKQKYPNLELSDLQEIFINQDKIQDKETILCLDHKEIINELIDHYSNLKDIYLVTHAEIIYHTEFEDIINIVKSSIKYNESVFYLICKYSEHYSQNQESRFITILTEMLIKILLSKNSKQFFQVDYITPQYIFLLTQFAFYYQSITQTPPGLVIGASFYFYKITMKLQFDRICQLFQRFINFNGNNQFFLSQSHSSNDFLADTIYSFLQMQCCTNEEFDQVQFFQNLFLKQFYLLLKDFQNQLSLEKQICLFQTINKILFRQNPNYNQKTFKEAKEFLTKFVQQDKDIINHLKKIPKIFEI